MSDRHAEKTFSLRLGDDRQRAEEAARQEGIAFSRWVREAVAEKLERTRREEQQNPYIPDGERYMYATVAPVVPPLEETEEWQRVCAHKPPEDDELG